MEGICREIYRGFKSHPVCHTLENAQQSPKKGISNVFRSKLSPNYDTFEKNYATTKRLYKVNNLYYYRRKIKNKLYRISLRTKDLKLALNRKKTFDIMSRDEFMYKMEKGDYKFFCEYDTFDEYKEIHKMAQEDYEKFLKERAKYETINTSIINADRKSKDPEYKITFVELELLFLRDSKEQGKVKESSYKAYNSTFSKLKTYFNDKSIASITIENFKDFRRYLMTIITNRKKPLSNGSINDIMLYLNMFIEYAIENKHIVENNVKAIKPLKTEEVVKDNFNDKQVLEILNYDKFNDKKYNFMFRMLAYHGIRFDDLYNIKQEWIIEKEGFLCIDLEFGKTKNAKRIIPIHSTMIEEIKGYKFPLWNKTKDGAYKELKRKLELIHKPNSGFGLHTFRGTFMEKAYNKYPGLLQLIQNVVGHKMSKESQLTIEKYAKNVQVQHYKNIVESAIYK